MKYCFVGPFTFQWNNPPAPFNPEYDERAAQWHTLSIYDAHVSGVYDKPIPERAALIRAFYDLRKSKGYVDKTELQKAKDYIYDL